RITASPTSSRVGNRRKSRRATSSSSGT
ncbi:uncharacterized protein METZ01_LOCUS501328, partial [marine metagenome]